MRTLIILIAFLFVEKLGLAQFFNKRFVVENRPTLNVGVGCLNDTIYVLGSAVVGPILDNNIRGYIMKSDRSGNFVDSTFITLSGKSQVAFYETSSLNIKDGEIAMTGYTWGGGKALLYVTNSNLDSLLLKEYGFVNSYRCFGHKLVKYTDGGYLIAGRMQFIGSVDVQILLIRTDSFGNEIWKNTYGDSTLAEAGYDIGLLQNGNVLIAAPSENTNRGSEAIYARAYYLEIDNLGNKVWEWRDPDTSTVLLAMTPTQDGGFVGVGSYVSFRSKPLGFEQKPYIVKFDSNKQKVWQKIFGQQWQTTALYDVVELADGSLLTCGRMRNNDIGTRTFGSICKFSAAGDSLWCKYYYGGDIPNEGRSNYLYDMEVLPDGSIVATGQADNDVVDPSQQGWLLHVDSNGCLLPGSCGVTAVEVVPAESVGLVKVYPNPAHNLLNIQLQNFTHLPGSIQILNTSGQVVMQQSVLSDEVQMDVAALPQGLYVVQVMEHGEVRVYKKFMKE